MHQVQIHAEIKYGTSQEMCIKQFCQAAPHCDTLRCNLVYCTAMPIHHSALTTHVLAISSCKSMARPKSHSLRTARLVNNILPANTDPVQHRSKAAQYNTAGGQFHPEKH